MDREDLEARMDAYARLAVLRERVDHVRNSNRARASMNLLEAQRRLAALRERVEHEQGETG